MQSNDRSPSRPGPFRRRSEALGISLLGGLVLYLGVRHPTFGPLVGAAWVLLMTPAVVDRWRAPLVGFLPGLALAIYVLWSPLLVFGWHVLLIIPLLSSWHFVLQPLLAAWLGRASGLPAFVVLPISVGAAEWTRPLLGFGHFNMYQTGSFLHSSPPLIQAADLVGALGLSVLWTVPWALLVDVIRWRLDGTGRRGRQTVFWGIGAAAGVLVLLLGYGWFRLTTDASIAGPTVAIVQPNVKHGIDRTPEVVRIQRQLTERYVPPGAADLVVWPENAILAAYEHEPVYQAVVREIARSRRSALLFGSQGIHVGSRRPTNTAFLVDDAGRILGRNDKIYLWPFTERRAFPLLERRFPAIERALSRLTIKAWGDAPDGRPGEQPRPMELAYAGGSWTFWAPICYETCYADIARDAARRGSRFFVNITSEGWLGWGFCNNQMAVSALRAVENRAGMVRAGNTGISCFIRPDGRVEEYLRGLENGRLLMEAGVLIHAVRIDPRAPTFYSAWGDAIDLVWPLGWLGLTAFYAGRRVWRRRRRP